jgi:hypothetical protein
MTDSVVVSGARRTNVVRIPNRALSFRPSPDVFRALGVAEPMAEADMTRDSDNIKPRDLWTFDGTRLVPIAVRLGRSDD